MPINPLNINTAQGGAGDFQAHGDRTIARQLGDGFKVTQTKGMSLPMSTPTTSATPATVVNFPSSSGGGAAALPPLKSPSGGAPSLTAPGKSVGEVLNTAREMAREDEFNPYVAPGSTPNASEVAPPRPGVIVMPEHYIFGDPTPDPAPVVGSGASSGPPPPPPPLSAPPLVSAPPPPKKSSPWLALAALAALAAVLF